MKAKTTAAEAAARLGVLIGDKSFCPFIRTSEYSDYTARFNLIISMCWHGAHSKIWISGKSAQMRDGAYVLHWGAAFRAGGCGRFRFWLVRSRELVTIADHTLPDVTFTRCT
jgi:hypothetical protein